MAQVVLESVSKAYIGGSTVVDQLSLCVDDRELLVLVGPSGCGKTTTLRLIAGLERPTSGRIMIGGREVTQVPPVDRDVAMVFQGDALYPHLSVYRNLSFGLELKYGGSFGARVLRRLVNPQRALELETQRQGIDAKVQQAARRLGIDSLLHRKPHQLSGGERQRVALGRAFVRNPAAFLLDEPLSNLDPQLKHQLRIEIKEIHRAVGSTLIYVTHDQVEAMTLGDRVGVMNRGKLLQVAQPHEIYDRPQNIFVARFFGSLPMNLIPGRLVNSEQGLIFESGPIRWAVPPSMARHLKVDGQQMVTLGFRAEDVVLERAPLGDSLVANSEEYLVTAKLTGNERWGDALVGRIEVPTGVPGDTRWWYVKGPKGAENCSAGMTVAVTCQPSCWHWFDTTTEQNLMTKN
jgi:multiple sugar transport system ATP-binding protein